MIHFKRLKGKKSYNHLDSKKSFDKVQYSFMVETQQIGKGLLNLQQTYTNVIINSEMLKIFLLGLVIETRMPAIITCIKIVL